MISPVYRRQLLLPLILLCASLCFASQSKPGAAAAADQDQTSARQAEPATFSSTTVFHLLRRIKSHLGTMTIGTGSSHYAEPEVLPLYYSHAYPFWGSYGYAQFWNRPYWGPVSYAYPPYPPSAVSRNGEGRVRLRIDPRTAEVLVNDVHAGTVAGLRGNLWLKPGTYDLCVRAPGRVELRRRIYVLRGKRITVAGTLAPANGPQNGKRP